MMEGIIYANIASSAAIIIILLLRKIFLNRVFSKAFVLLWLAVIIRLLLPFEFSSALSVYKADEMPKTVMTETADVFEAEENFIYYENVPNDFSLAYPLTEKRAEISQEDIVFAVWISGALFFGTVFAARHFSAVRKIKADLIPFDDLPAEFKNRDIRFYKSKNLCSPLSFGILHSAAVIPENISQKQLPFVLLHEQTHIENRDATLKFAAAAALSINWFNPLVWVMVKYFLRDIERCCDEKVLALLKGEKASFYANTILDFAERESLSVSFFSAASLEERVISIMKNKTKQKHIPGLICVFAAIILVMTACGTTPRMQEKEPVEAGNLSETIQEAAKEETPSLLLDIESGKTEPEAEPKEELLPSEAFQKAEENYQYTVPGDFGGYRIDFTWPCEETEVTCQLWGYKGHTGIDIGVNKGSKIYAAAEGTVVKVKISGTGYGNHIIIDHGSGVQTLYAHCSDIFVALGQKVEKGEEIARTGSTGNSTGTHLHFEVRENGVYVDPLKHIPTPAQEKYLSSAYSVLSRKNYEKLDEIAAMEFVLPSKGYISCDFDGYESHAGIDFAAEKGSAVNASAGGTVVAAEWSSKDPGNYIIIDHGNGIQTVYAHCEELLAEEGKTVKAGEQIATMGASGNSTGIHLHFEIRYNGEYQNPSLYFPKA